MKRIVALVAHGGGPTPVLNATLLGVIEEARAARFRHLWAPLGGLAGILRGNVVDLLAAAPSRLQKLRPQCGSVIGSYRGSVSDGDLGKIVEFLRAREIRCLFYTGGNGSMGTLRRIAAAARMSDYHLSAIGIPKTVDNDICNTDHCPGFGSAARFAALAVREMGLDQRALPTPVSIIEVMGRNTGWLAAATLLARQRPDDPPHFIYVPETSFGGDEFLSRVDRLLRVQGWAVGVVAEGLRDRTGRILAGARGSSRDAKGRPLAGDVAARLARLVSQKLRVRARSEKPGLLCRAFSPCQSPVDAAEALNAGRFAVRAALAGHSEMMVAFRRAHSRRYRCQFVLVPLAKVAERERCLPARYLDGPGDIREEYRAYAAPLVGPLPAAPVWFHDLKKE